MTDPDSKYVDFKSETPENSLFHRTRDKMARLFAGDEMAQMERENRRQIRKQEKAYKQSERNEKKLQKESMREVRKKEREKSDKPGLLSKLPWVNKDENKTGESVHMSGPLSFDESDPVPDKEEKTASETVVKAEVKPVEKKRNLLYKFFDIFTTFDSQIKLQREMIANLTYDDIKEEYRDAIREFAEDQYKKQAEAVRVAELKKKGKKSGFLRRKRKGAGAIDVVATGTSASAEGALSGPRVFNKELIEKGHTEAFVAMKNIAVLIYLLRQDYDVNHDKKRSLLRRLNYDRQSLEELLQCAFKIDITDVNSLIESPNGSAYLIMKKILGYDNPNAFTVAQMANESAKEKPFAALADSMRQYDELREKLGAKDHVGELAKYLKESNDTLETLDNQLHDDPELIQHHLERLEQVEAELNEMGRDKKKSDDGSPEYKAVRKQGSVKFEEVKKLKKKLKALQAYETLRLDEKITDNPTKFDVQAVRHTLKRLNLLARNVPDDFPFEAVMENADSAYYLSILEWIRIENELDDNEKAHMALRKIDVDSSLLAALIHESESTPVEHLIIMHCEKPPIKTAQALIDKIDEIIVALTAVIDNNTVAGSVLNYLNAENISPAELETEMMADPEIIQRLIAEKKKLEASSKVQEANVIGKKIKALRSFMALKNNPEAKASRKIPDNFNEWQADLQNDEEYEEYLAILGENRNEFNEDLENALNAVDSDPSLLRAWKEDTDKSIEQVIYEHSDLDSEDLEGLKKKIKEIYTHMEESQYNS